MESPKRRITIGFCSLLLLLVSCHTAIKESIEPVSLGGMNKLHRVGDVYLGSQPSEADLIELKNRGVQTVINLRHEAELGEFDEAAASKALGMRYVHVPFNGGNELTDAVFDQVLDALDSKEPVLMHCASANRVGALWMAYRMQEHGLDYDEALAEARTAGLRSTSYIERVKEYVGE